MKSFVAIKCVKSFIGIMYTIYFKALWFKWKKNPTIKITLVVVGL